jgi:uncharacterized heparinase superfamily protein
VPCRGTFGSSSDYAETFVGLTDGDVMRLARTVAQLRPAQAGQRFRLRAQRLALNKQLPTVSRWLLSGPEPTAAVGWPDEFTPLDAGIWRGWSGEPGLRAGQVSLLGVTRMVAPTADSGAANWPAADWELASEPLLWRFHLYYWDWAWALACGQDRHRSRTAFAAIWQSWRAAVPPGRGPAWHPYPAALRAWSFCGLYLPLVAGSPISDPFRSELAVHLGFLRRNLETDVGGNHLIKNLKALAGLAVFFADADLLTRVLRRLCRQLAVQVLPDGGHYERAPAYHCQVLGDLIDIGRLLGAVGQDEPPELTAAVQAMRCWLGAVLTPAGDVPLLNDGFPVSRSLLEQLAPGPPPGGALHVLPDTGLARVTAGGWQLLVDIGLPCPRELPGHAHADTLSCLVYLDGAPLLIDTGTSSYAVGPVRQRERSTAAHNTLEVDCRDSTEVWGAFRAGRRARVHGVAARADGDTVTVEAAHDGYRSLPGRPVHHRSWALSARELRVDDCVTGKGRHQIVVRWHLPPLARLRLVPGGAEISTASGQFIVTVTANPAVAPAISATQAEVSTGFCRTVQAPVLASALHSELPVRITTIWRRSQPTKESV